LGATEAETLALSGDKSGVLEANAQRALADSGGDNGGTARASRETSRRSTTNA
jgi:hypothetical protein